MYPKIYTLSELPTRRPTVVLPKQAHADRALMIHRTQLRTREKKSIWHLDLRTFGCLCGAGGAVAGAPNANRGRCNTNRRDLIPLLRV